MHKCLNGLSEHKASLKESMTKKVASIFLIYFILLMIFIAATWFKVLYNGSGEMADSIFLIFLVIATIYYFIFTNWTYVLFKKSSNNKSYSLEVQLVCIFIFGILSSLYLLLRIYS